MATVLKLKTAPAIEPVTLAEVKLDRGIASDVTDDDTLLSAYITSARETIEDLCGPLITQTWYQYMDAWPSGDELVIGKPRVLTLTSVKYTNSAGVQSTLSASAYTLDTVEDQKPRIVLKTDQAWPTDDLFNVRPIVLEFTVGFGATAASVPKNLWRAMMLLIADAYENREPILVGQAAVSLPLGVDALIGNYRVWGL